MEGSPKKIAFLFTFRFRRNIFYEKLVDFDLIRNYNIFII